MFINVSIYNFITNLNIIKTYCLTINFQDFQSIFLFSYFNVIIFLFVSYVAKTPQAVKPINLTIIKLSKQFPHLCTFTTIMYVFKENVPVNDDDNNHKKKTTAANKKRRKKRNDKKQQCNYKDILEAH